MTYREWKHYKVGDLVKAIPLNGVYIDGLEKGVIYTITEKRMESFGQHYYYVRRKGITTRHFTRDEVLISASSCKSSCCEDGNKVGCPFREEVT